MADEENPFAHLIPGGGEGATTTAAPDDNPFAHLIPADKPVAPPPQTPATDEAIKSSDLTPTFGRFAQNQYIKNLSAQQSNAESNAQWQKFMEESGKPIGGALPRYSEEAYRRNSPLANIWPSAPWAVKTAGGLYNAAAGLSDFVTSPRGLAELGVTVATGGAAGIPLLAAEMTPHLPDQAKQVYKAATGQLSPEESAETAGGLGLLLAPGAHVIGKKFGPREFTPSMPAPPGTVYEGLPFDTREVPFRPPMPSKYTTTDPKLVADPGEGVGPVVEVEKGKPGAPPVQTAPATGIAYEYVSPEAKPWWEKAQQLQAAYNAAAKGSPERAAARKAFQEHEEIVNGTGDRYSRVDPKTGAKESALDVNLSENTPNLNRDLQWEPATGGTSGVTVRRGAAAATPEHPAAATPEQVKGFKQRAEEAQHEIDLLVKMGIAASHPEKIQERVAEIEHLNKQIAGEIPPDALSPMAESSRPGVEKRADEMYAGKTEAERKAIVDEEMAQGASPLEQMKIAKAAGDLNRALRIGQDYREQAQASRDKVIKDWEDGVGPDTYSKEQADAAIAKINAEPLIPPEMQSLIKEISAPLEQRGIGVKVPETTETAAEAAMPIKDRLAKLQDDVFQGKLSQKEFFDIRDKLEADATAETEAAFAAGRGLENPIPRIPTVAEMLDDMNQGRTFSGVSEKRTFPGFKPEEPFIEGEFTKLPAEQKALTEGAAPVKERKDMTATELSADIARQRADPAAPPVSILDTQLLRQKQEAEARQQAPPKAEEPLATDNPRLKELKAQTANLRNQAADVLRKTRKIPMGESRQAREQRRELAREHDKVLTKLWQTWDEIHQIRTDSGKPREFVIIGGGAGGLKAAGHAAYEGVDTLLLEKEGVTGGQAKRSLEIVNTGATGEGVTGKDYFRARYLTAKNRGAQVRTGVEVVNLRPREDGGVDVITKHHGVIPAQRVALLTGSDIVEFPGMEHSGWGNAERLERLSAGKTGMTYGGGNSASQAIVGAIREGANKIVVVSRKKFGSDVSADQMDRIKAYAEEGKVELVQGQIKKITPDPATGGVKVTIAKTGPKGELTGEVVEIPVAHLENFLSTKLNTGWLPEGISKVPTFDRKGNPVSGPVKVRDASLKTNMQGVYVGGDIRESLPGEEKARRIDIAEGDAAGIAARVTKEVLKARKSGKLDPWEATPEEIRALDEELKILRREEAERTETTPSTPSTGGPTIPSPTTSAPISSATSSTSAVRTKTPPPKGVSDPFQLKKKAELPPPPSPPNVAPPSQDQRQRAVGAAATAPARSRFYVVPGEYRPPEVDVAKQIAEDQHKGQKHGERPYTDHVQDVVDSVRPDLRAAAYLHDVVEDTRMSPRKMAEKGISNKTIETVDHLTRRPSETYSKYIDRVAENGDAREIKMADLRANLRTLPEDSTLRPRYTKALDRLMNAEAAAADPVRVQAEANARVQANPNYADKVVSDLNSGRQQSMDLADEVVLTEQRGKIQNARDIAGQRAMNEKLPKEERAAAASNFEDMDARVRELDRATVDGEMLKGPKQRANWHNFRARDYSLPSMEQKLNIARGGKPLTPHQQAAQTADLKQKTDTLATRMAAVEKYKGKIGWRPGMGAKGNIGNLRHKQFKMQQAKSNLDNTVFAEVLKNKTYLSQGAYYYRNVAGVSRAIMTADWTSALLRQGGLLFFGGPQRSLRIMGDVVRATKSDENYFRLMQDIRERPNAEMYVRSKLGLTEIKSPKMQDLEEQYMGQWVDKIPVLAHSQRAYVYFLNRLRADTFDTMVDKLGRNGNVTLQQANEIANFINVFTGRGRIKEQYAGGIAALNELFFAPRYVLSRFQALTLQPLRYAKDPQVRKLIAAEYAKTLIGYGIFYGLASTALKQFDVEIEKNPLSTDFGKIKMGDSRWDPLSGLAQVTTFLSRAITAHTKTAQGEIQPLFGKKTFIEKSYGAMLWEFLRTKFAPLPGAVVNVQSGKKVTGEETNLYWEALGLVTPISGWDVYKNLQAQGATKGVALSLIANFGHAVNTYSTRVKTRQKKRHRSR